MTCKNHLQNKGAQDWPRGCVVRQPMRRVLSSSSTPGFQCSDKRAERAKHSNLSVLWCQLHRWVPKLSFSRLVWSSVHKFVHMEPLLLTTHLFAWRNSADCRMERTWSVSSTDPSGSRAANTPRTEKQLYNSLQKFFIQLSLSPRSEVFSLSSKVPTPVWNLAVSFYYPTGPGLPANATHSDENGFLPNNF